MNKISILGCGWLGTQIGKHLVQNGFQVLGSRTSVKEFEHLQAMGIESHLVKIGTSEENSSFEHDFFKSDLLIVGLKPQRKIDDEGEFIHRNKTIIELVVKHQISRVIVLSSTSVYSDNHSIVNEDSFPIPQKHGGKNLLSVEVLWCENLNFTCTVLRLGGLIGYDRNPINTLKQGRATENLFVPVNLVHSDDVASIILQLIKQPNVNGVFNVVADAHPLRIDFYRPAFKALQLALPTFESQTPSNFKLVDNSKLKMALNYNYIMQNPLQMWEWQSHNFQTLNLNQP